MLVKERILSTLLHIARLFLKVVIPICTQTGNILESLLFHTPANICYCQPIKNFANLMVSHYSFNIHFSDFQGRQSHYQQALHLLYQICFLYLHLHFLHEILPFLNLFLFLSFTNTHTHTQTHTMPQYFPLVFMLCKAESDVFSILTIRSGPNRELNKYFLTK